MKVKMCFDAQFCGHAEVLVDVQDEISDHEIRALFPKELGIEFDENCFYEIVKG